MVSANVVRYFADRNIFCAGRVTNEDMERVVQAVGASVQSTCTDIRESHLGTCAKFEERQIGGERYNIFSGCPAAKTCTLILRGGAEQFIAEVERSLHDAIMIVKKAIKNDTIVAGGGALEMEISKYLREYSRTIAGKQQLIIAAYAKALEIIPRQLCDNAGFDATDMLNKLRMRHAKGETWAGIDIVNEGIRDNLEAFVWEPVAVKVNAIQAATEAACLILSVDETIKNQESAQPQSGPPVCSPLFWYSYFGKMFVRLTYVIYRCQEELRNGLCEDGVGACRGGKEGLPGGWDWSEWVG